MRSGFFRGSCRQRLIVARTRNVQHKIIGRPKVSIIILTKSYKLLRSCLDSIVSKTSYTNYEVIVVVNNTKRKENLQLKDRRLKYIYVAESFNFSRLNNLAVRYSSGAYLLFLNDDTQVVNYDWLEALLEQAQRRKVGAVGCRLVYPDGLLQHGGIVIGTKEIASHIRYDTNFYTGDIDVIRNCSAVTGACLMIKKSLFQEIGMFDECFPFSCNDIDLCLRLQEKGYLIVYTPYATLIHCESKTRGYENRSVGADEGKKLLLKKLGDLTVFNDPYYDTNLKVNRK